MGDTGHHKIVDTEKVLLAKGIGKSYRGRCVLSNLSLSLDKGVYALQGANGIGKSTLLGILCGAIEPDSGEISIEGSNLYTSPLAARRKLSYVPDEAHVYPFLSGRELLQLVAHAKHASLSNDLFDLLERFAVGPFLDSRIDAMSFGTQKKFLLLAGFIGDPKVYIADEISNGLDKQTRPFLAERLRIQAENGTVLFSSHDADFIAQTGASILEMEYLLEQ